MSIVIKGLNQKVNMVTLTTPDLPDAIKRLHTPPKQLFLSSDSLDTILSRPRIGIVGSRKVTPYGRAVTESLSSDLASKGVVIVSGLALGIDSIAHASCLRAGGTTVAVLPAGLDKICPTSHTQLARDIVSSGGLLVSEYPERTAPLRPNFVARNRIIAALSEGLLIPEAAIASGSLHTARFALELGIPVFAVPGPITSPMSEGTNNLIKSGAIPVTGVEDILTALNWQDTASQKSDYSAHSQEERVILELIQSGTSDGHELLAASELEPAAFNQALTMLEITGAIRPLGANHWAIA